MKTFKHSGNLGDIIFSLPTIIALGGGILLLESDNSKPDIDEKAPFPFPFSSDQRTQMIELLKKQPYLKEVRPFAGEKVDYDLDKFREYVVNNKPGWRTHLAKWNLRTFNVQFDLASSWLHNIEPHFVSDIVITFSARASDRTNRFNWNALKGFEQHCVFIGFDEDYSEFKSYTGLDIKRHQKVTILEFAQIIKGSKFLISNQTFGFTLAEAMKHPRAIEIFYYKSVSLPQSCNGYIHISKRLITKHLSKGASQHLPHSLDRAIARLRNIYFHKIIEERIKDPGYYQDNHNS